MKLIDEIHKSKNRKILTPCGNVYTNISFDRSGKIIQISHKLGKEGGCKQSQLNTHAIEQNGNIMAYRLIQKIKRMIDGKDIEFKRVEDRESLLENLGKVEKYVSLKSISEHLKDVQCGQTPVIENGIECCSCIDGMAQNLSVLIRKDLP